MSGLGARRRFGRTGLAVTPLALGTSSWTDDRVDDLAAAFFAERLATNLLDTSNMYGATPAGPRSEQLVGHAAATSDATGLVVQTKLDRDLATGDFGADRMWRSVEESLTRLGTSRIDVLYLHDPEVVGFETVTEPGGAVDALVEMRRQGLATSIGISGGPVAMLQRFVETGVFDALVTHNRFTLLDRSAGSLLDSATSHDVGIANAAPYGGGVLAGRPGSDGQYGYRPIRPEAIRALERLRGLAADAGVPVSALALGFSLRDPRVHTTVVGASSLDSWNRAVEDATAAAAAPQELWDAVGELADGIPALDAA